MRFLKLWQMSIYVYLYFLKCTNNHSKMIFKTDQGEWVKRHWHKICGSKKSWWFQIAEFEDQRRLKTMPIIMQTQKPAIALKHSERFRSWTCQGATSVGGNLKRRLISSLVQKQSHSKILSLTYIARELPLLKPGRRFQVKVLDGLEAKRFLTC